MHKINFIWPQKLPGPLASQSLFAEEKPCEAKLPHLQDPAENVSHQAGPEVIAELNSANSRLKREQLGVFPLLSEACLGLDLPLLTELSNVQEGRAECAQLWRGTKGKSTPGISSASFFTAQTGRKFPTFPIFFLPFLSFLLSLPLLSFNYIWHFKR